MLTRFHLRPWAKRCVIAACLAVIAVQWVVIMHRRASGNGHGWLSGPPLATGRRSPT